MTLPAPSATQTLLKKIQSLPTDRITEVEDFVDFLRERTTHKKIKKVTKKKQLDFPTLSVGKWPEDLSLRREDMYGDDGR
ncbi:MAG: DUF2281 domain-containing protein [Gammaproteobacteria bacterium]|nr:DUF2281 domain-containing protein [Gammaproteobacteria bacterium]